MWVLGITAVYMLKESDGSASLQLDLVLRVVRHAYSFIIAPVAWLTSSIITNLLRARMCIINY